MLFFFVVLEELGGGTLTDLIAKRTGGILPRSQALDIARQLACALQHLQEDLSPFAMIIHRGTYVLVFVVLIPTKKLKIKFL